MHFPVATAGAPDESTRFVQPRLVGAPIVGAPLIASVTIQHSLSTGAAAGDLESRRAVFYRSSDGKTRTDMFTEITGDQQSNPKLIALTDPKRGMTEMLDPSSRIDCHIKVQEVPFIMAGGCCPEKMIALQSSELSLLQATGLEIPRLGLGWRGDSVEVDPITDIDGFGVEGYGQRFTLRNAANGNRQDITITVKSWYAPKIKAVLGLEVSDSRSGTTKVRLSHLQLKEPEDSLFTVPTEYRVVGQKAARTK
jgi:hypothetical protein